MNSVKLIIQSFLDSFTNMNVWNKIWKWNSFISSVRRTSVSFQFTCNLWPMFELVNTNKKWNNSFIFLNERLHIECWIFFCLSSLLFLLWKTFLSIVFRKKKLFLNYLFKFVFFLLCSFLIYLQFFFLFFLIYIFIILGVHCRELNGIKLTVPLRFLAYFWQLERVYFHMLLAEPFMNCVHCLHFIKYYICTLSL